MMRKEGKSKEVFKAFYKLKKKKGMSGRKPS